MNLYHGDCLEVLPTFPPASVEAIITDLPYGTTACEWDSIIPLAPMWEQVKRVLKPTGVFISTASQPFTTVLIASNLDWFKYEWSWNKSQVSNPQLAKIQPLKIHENICVFGSGRITYNPQELSRDIAKVLARRSKWERTLKAERRLNHIQMAENYEQEFTNYPKSIIYFPTKRNDVLHPTEKPIRLFEYLIRTYTNAGETVLDICMGSGTTGVAAVQTGREFIGIEKERKYFEIAEKRVRLAHPPLFVEQPRQPTPLALDNWDSPVFPSLSKQGGTDDK
jgi:site-specific DNA-methyltransferase (adenine-specific)